MKKDRIVEKYNTLIHADMHIRDASNILARMESDPDIIELRKMFCDTLVYKMSVGSMFYPELSELRKCELFRVFERNVKKLPKDCSFLWMFYSALTQNKATFYKHFDALVAETKKGNVELLDGNIVDLFIEPIKNTVPGFWTYAHEQLSPLCKQDGSHEICLVMDKFYSDMPNKELIDSLTEFIRKYPDVVTARELLAMVYWDMKMWKNAIACLESIDEPVLYWQAMHKYHFKLAFAYGKVKELKKEEEHYRKALEINPQTLYANNNLGYCLYRQKKFAEAEKVLRHTVEQKLDFPYSFNNYARVLIALGKNVEAKKLAKTFKLSKSFRKKIENLPNHNTKVTKSSPKRTTDYKDDLLHEQSVTAATTTNRRNSEQFSCEKHFEDELANRIDKGFPVFGKNLKMYRSNGEYGRQFIIPIGRLDLLCEDEHNNLYIIELKKDSGYDDAYKQLKRYIDWFTASKEFSDKNIRGILCLNSPTNQLINKVKADDRIELYEYQLSYSKIA